MRSKLLSKLLCCLMLSFVIMPFGPYIAPQQYGYTRPLRGHDYYYGRYFYGRTYYMDRGGRIYYPVGPRW